MADSIGAMLQNAVMQQPYIGNPNLRRQGDRAGIGRRTDVFSGPATAFAAGLMGVSPQDQSGSVLDPNSARMSPVASNLGYAAGLTAMAAPLGNALISLGKSAKIAPSMARSSASIYDPKPQPQRPFNADYPSASQSDGGGRLAYDLDGRPLAAQYVAGRRMVGEADEAITAGGVDDIGSLLGAATLRGPASGELRGSAGRYIRGADPNGDTLRRILLDQSLPPEQAMRVQAHETGHLIDDLTFGGAIPTAGLKKELATLFENQNTGGWFKPGRGMTPQGMGYKGDDVDRELIAEAIRAYMRDPNYIKTVAPKTAARIREYVNANPNLNKVIQFNSMGGGVAAAGYGLQDQESQ